MHISGPDPDLLNQEHGGKKMEVKDVRDSFYAFLSTNVILYFILIYYIYC